MEWSALDDGTIQGEGSLGLYILKPRKLDPNTNRYGAEQEWSVQFLKWEAESSRPKEIDSSTSIENAKWMAENYDGYRAS